MENENPGSLARILRPSPSLEFEIDLQFEEGSSGKVASTEPVPGLILDRDGVIVEEVSYLHKIEDVRILPGATALLSWARSVGVPVAVATNQAGIARGIFGWDQYREVSSYIRKLLEDAGVCYDLVVACGFHPDFTPQYGANHAYWRKPGPGMLKFAAKQLNLDISRSWMIGDNVSDIEAALAAGMAGAVHVLTGHGRKYRLQAASLRSPKFDVLLCDSLQDALPLLQRLLNKVR